MSDIPEPWRQALIDAGVTDPRNASRPSLSELARRVGAHTSTISAMVTGSRETKQGTIDAVAEALRIDPRVVAEWVGRARVVREPFVPHEAASLLDHDERDAINRLIGLMTRGRGGQHGRAAADAQKNNVTPIRGATRTPDTMDKAAWGHTAPGRLQAHEDEQRGEESQDPGE